MAPSPPHPSLVLLLVLAMVALSVSPASSTSRHALHHRPAVQDGIRVSLKRVDAGGNFTLFERLQRAINRGKQRLERLSAMGMKAAEDEVQTPVIPGDGEFLINLNIGTPPVAFKAILDTGSDLIWTQCKPCTDCYDQPTPIFDPKKSSSFSTLPCSSDLCQAVLLSKCKSDCEYLYAYGDYSTTQGVMATETLTFGNSSIPKIAFGCGEDNEGTGFSQADGLMGLGRGPLSLISQIGSAKFSYCLGSMDDSTSSSLIIGSQPSTDKKDSAFSTPLIPNPSHSTYYYLSLEGITVGDTKLSIPKSTFSLQEDGSGGMIIDSGTTITYLEESAFKLVKKAFVSQIKLSVDNGNNGLDLCFTLPAANSNIEVPKLIFHFKDADLDLPVDNYMIADSGLGLLCLTMGESSGMSVFGNMQQQNMLVLHDLEKGMLTFVPHQCD